MDTSRQSKSLRRSSLAEYSFEIGLTTVSIVMQNYDRYFKGEFHGHQPLFSKQLVQSISVPLLLVCLDYPQIDNLIAGTCCNLQLCKCLIVF